MQACRAILGEFTAEFRESFPKNQQNVFKAIENLSFSDWIRALIILERGS
jgi:hypothetical protein